MKKSHWKTWLRANGHNTAPLTGQDARALDAIAACWDLYASGDSTAANAAIRAVRELLPAMQENTRPPARELIARSMDWIDRDRVWAVVEAGADLSALQERIQRLETERETVYSRVRERHAGFIAARSKHSGDPSPYPALVPEAFPIAQVSR